MDTPDITVFRLSFYKGPYQRHYVGYLSQFLNKAAVLARFTPAHLGISQSRFDKAIVEVFYCTGAQAAYNRYVELMTHSKPINKDMSGQLKSLIASKTPPSNGTAPKLGDDDFVTKLFAKVALGESISYGGDSYAISLTKKTP